MTPCPKCGVAPTQLGGCCCGGSWYFLAWIVVLATAIAVVFSKETKATEILTIAIGVIWLVLLAELLAGRAD